MTIIEFVANNFALFRDYAPTVSRRAWEKMSSEERVEMIRRAGGAV